MAAAGPQADDAILVVDDIVVRYETPDGPITAVDDVSFKVRPGEFLSVIGPSGCGKSTLFNVIGGLLSHHQGVVSVAGETISGPHKSIGMVFQEESTFPWRTVIDNVAFPLELVGMAKAKRAERARHFIGMVGLDGFENRYPGELSGGMHQRGVRPLRRANLERPARRGEPRHARRGSSRAASRRSIVVTAAAPARRARPGNFAAATVGLGALAALS